MTKAYRKKKKEMKRERLQLAANALTLALESQKTAIQARVKSETVVAPVRVSDLVIFQFKSQNLIQYLWYKDNRLATYDYSWLMEEGKEITIEIERTKPPVHFTNLKLIPDPMETLRSKAATPLNRSLMSHILRKADG